MSTKKVLTDLRRIIGEGKQEAERAFYEHLALTDTLSAQRPRPTDPGFDTTSIAATSSTSCAPSTNAASSTPS